MRSLQPPDILWIHWRVYNCIVNTSKRVLFLPPSDAYVRSFLYLLYTLIKLYYTKVLSDQASSLAPDWILLLRGPRIPVYSRDSTTTFHKSPAPPSLQLHPGPLCPPYVCSTSLFPVLHTDLFYLRTFACDSQHLEDFIFSSLPLGSVSVHTKLLQSCPTLCSPMDCSLPDSSVHGILKSVAMPSSRESQPRDRTHVSYVSCIGRPHSFFVTSATWEASV